MNDNNKKANDETEEKDNAFGASLPRGGMGVT